MFNYTQLLLGKMFAFRPGWIQIAVALHLNEKLQCLNMTGCNKMLANPTSQSISAISGVVTM